MYVVEKELCSPYDNSEIGLTHHLIGEESELHAFKEGMLVATIAAIALEHIDPPDGMRLCRDLQRGASAFHHDAPFMTVMADIECYFDYHTGKINRELSDSALANNMNRQTMSTFANNFTFVTEAGYDGVMTHEGVNPYVYGSYMIKGMLGDERYATICRLGAEAMVYQHCLIWDSAGSPSVTAPERYMTFGAWDNQGNFSPLVTVMENIN